MSKFKPDNLKGIVVGQSKPSKKDLKSVDVDALLLSYNQTNEYGIENNSDLVFKMYGIFEKIREKYPKITEGTVMVLAKMLTNKLLYDLKYSEQIENLLIQVMKKLED